MNITSNSTNSSNSENLIFNSTNVPNTTNSNSFGNVISNPTNSSSFGNIISNATNSSSFGNIISNATNSSSFGNIISNATNSSSFGNIISNVTNSSSFGNNSTNSGTFGIIVSNATNPCNCSSKNIPIGATNSSNFERIMFQNISKGCANYRAASPTATYLLQNAPAGYLPLLAVSAALVVINSLLLGIEIRKHSKFYKGVHFKLASRITMLLCAFWLYTSTNFLGMMFVRSDVFLDFIAHAFESACMLAFFDCVVVHMRKIGGGFDGQGMILTRVPPLGCCLFCLPNIKNTKTNLLRLRYAIFQLIFIQSGMEFLRVLAVFDCAYDPQALHSIILDIIVVVSFLFAIYALNALVKTNQTNLSKYNYFYKFVGFKLMIISSKLSEKVFLQLADSGVLSSANDLGARQQGKIWSDFVTVLVSTILFLVCRRFYTVEEYKGKTCAHQYNCEGEVHAIENKSYKTLEEEET